MPSDGPDLNASWPVLRTYRGERLRRVAMPLGGIGTGTVSLGGRGNLRDWEIVNRPAKGFVPTVPITRNMTEPRAFFAARVQAQGKPPVTRLLEGDLDPVDFEGTVGSPAPHHGLPRFASASFHAAYPLAQVCLRDPDLPVDLRLEAFNPLIPGRADDSGLPIAVLRWVAANLSDVPVRVSICVALANFIGTDGKYGEPKRNVNRWRVGNGLRGLDMRSDGVATDAEQWGDQTVTARTAWHDIPWGDALLDFWDDFSADGELDDRPTGDADSPTASLAAGTPGETAPATRRPTRIAERHTVPSFAPLGPTDGLHPTGCCALHRLRPANVLPTFWPAFRRAGRLGVALGTADYRSGEPWRRLE